MSPRKNSNNVNASLREIGKEFKSLQENLDRMRVQLRGITATHPNWRASTRRSARPRARRNVEVVDMTSDNEQPSTSATSSSSTSDEDVQCVTDLSAPALTSSSSSDEDIHITTTRRSVPLEDIHVTTTRRSVPSSSSDSSTSGIASTSSSSASSTTSDDDSHNHIMMTDGSSTSSGSDDVTSSDSSSTSSDEDIVVMPSREAASSDSSTSSNRSAGTVFNVLHRLLNPIGSSSDDSDDNWSNRSLPSPPPLVDSDGGSSLTSGPPDLSENSDFTDLSDMDDDLYLSEMSPVSVSSGSDDSDTDIQIDAELPDVDIGEFTSAPVGSINYARYNAVSDCVDYYCPVCLDNYSTLLATNRGLMSTYCGHIFCSQCITKAVKKKHVCPVCHKKTTPKEIHPLYIN